MADFSLLDNSQVDNYGTGGNVLGTFDPKTQSYPSRQKVITTVADDVRRRYPDMPDAEAVDYVRLTHTVETLAVLGWATSERRPIQSAYIALLATPLSVLRAIESIIREPGNAARTNPYVPRGGCAYLLEEPDPLADAADGNEIVTRRCLLGELLHRWGFEYEERWENRGVGNVMIQALGFARDTARVAEAVQRIADQGDPDGISSEPRLTWGQAWETIKQDRRFFDATGRVYRDVI